MTLPELCIKRPVFTTMLILLPVTLGIFSYLNMGVDLFPNVDLPIVTVTTTRAGTSVEEMETGVTKVLEEAVNTISGIDELRSTTKEGISSLNIIFVLEKNRDVAQQEVQSKINTILSRLPTGTDAPIIDKFDVDASPVMTIAVSGRRPIREITEIADKQIKESLSSLSGVGSVSLVGGRRRAINVTVNARRLEAYNLSIEQIRAALANQNLELPGGRVDQNSRELILRTMGRVDNVKQFGEIIVANVAGQPIRIRDLGTVDDSFEEPRSIGRLDGDNAVLLVVQKQSGTNTVEVIDTVKRKLTQMAEGFAAEGRADIHMETIRDQSRFINASLHEVKKHLVLGAILVGLTILLFLRDWRTMIIASLSIPVSLVSTFMVMKWLGFTLNNITMLAMVLAVGIVIDDAVVVHENIFRWMEEKGLGAWDAALGATREIALAVMATTFSLVVIFLPIAFMSGRVGRFFFSFGITTAISILMSMLVSFTLTPMLCSRFLKLSEKARREGKSHHSGGIYGRLIEQPYLWSLRWSMRHRWIIITAAAVVVMSIFPFPPVKYPGLFKMVGIDFLPKDDQSEFEIAITTPEGWTLDRTDQTFREIEGKLRNMNGVINVMTAIGDTSGRFTRAQGEVTRGSIYVRLVNLPDRKTKFSQFDMMADARKLLLAYPDLRTSVQIPAAISSGQVNAEVEFTLVGPDLAKLGQYSDQMIEKLRLVPGLTDVDTTLALRKPEMRVEINRDRASDLGVNVQTVASTLGIFVGGQVVSDFRDNQIGELYDVWLRASGADRDDAQVVANLTIPSTKAGLIKVGNIANIGEARGPSQIDRFARQRKISLVANLAGMPTNIAQQTFQNTFADLKAGPQYSLIASGRAKTQNESNAAFLMAFGFSLIFMYMILAAQFESFVHPITILLAVPITIPFALLSLIILGQSMTIYSILGIFLLFGIVKKNGILQVDYTNVLRHRAAEDANEVPEAYRRNGELHRDGEVVEKMSRWQRWVSRQSEEKRTRLWAIIEANRTRLRPILMTTLMLIAGMVPIALGQGPGAASRASMAKVIVGGQALSLLLSLLVTPVGYSLFDDITLWRRNRARRKAAKDVVPVELQRPVPAGEPAPLH
ncbi:MAG TPA: efflux RND transporter permease subunit [Tepidisphaeraceae bacterium]|nr:efflux RND transporter permease subunit [Tepidisphaeraceae bacterium]